MKGLEPSTFCMASRRSSQLSYIRVAAQYNAAPAAQTRTPPGRPSSTTNRVSVEAGTSRARTVGTMR